MQQVAFPLRSRIFGQMALDRLDPVTRTDLATTPAIASSEDPRRMEAPARLEIQNPSRPALFGARERSEQPRLELAGVAWARLPTVTQRGFVDPSDLTQRCRVRSLQRIQRQHRTCPKLEHRARVKNARGARRGEGAQKSTPSRVKKIRAPCDHASGP